MLIKSDSPQSLQSTGGFVFSDQAGALTLSSTSDATGRIATETHATAQQVWREIAAAFAALSSTEQDDWQNAASMAALVNARGVSWAGNNFGLYARLNSYRRRFGEPIVDNVLAAPTQGEEPTIDTVERDTGGDLTVSGTVNTENVDTLVIVSATDPHSPSRSGGGLSLRLLAAVVVSGSFSPVTYAATGTPKNPVAVGDTISLRVATVWDVNLSRMGTLQPHAVTSP